MENEILNDYTLSQFIITSTRYFYFIKYFLKLEDFDIYDFYS